MKLSKIQFLFLFLVSCSGIKEEIKIEKSIPPDNFIKNQTVKIKKNLEMGPSQKKDGMKIKRQRKIIFAENNKNLKGNNEYNNVVGTYYSKKFIPFQKFPGEVKKKLKKIEPNQELNLLRKVGHWYQFLINKNLNDSIVYGYFKPVFGNIRLKPSMKSKVVHIGSKNQLFQIIDKKNNWYKVSYTINSHGKLPIELELQESFISFENPFKIGTILGKFNKKEKVLVYEQVNNYLLISDSKNIGWIKIPNKFNKKFFKRKVYGWVHKNIIKKLTNNKIYSTVWVDYKKFSKDLTSNPTEPKISLNFDGVSIKEAFKTLGDLSGRNILVGDDVTGFITAKLNNVNFETAFNSLLKLKSLGKIKEENITSIHNIGFIKNYERSKNERITELHKLNKIKDGLKPLFTEIFTIYYAKAKDIKIQIDEIFGGKGESVNIQSPEISVDERTNTLIVKGNKSQLNLTSQIIKNIDIKTDQILIEAFILEVNDDFEKKLGTRIGFSGNSGDFSSSGLASGPVTDSSGSSQNTLALGSTTGSVSNLLIQNAFGGIGLIMNPGRLSLKLELNALEKEGVTNILSNPRIFTLDNEMALISQGVSVPRPGTSFGGGTITEFEPAELKLAVTPNVVGDGNIILDVEVDKDTPDFARNPTSPPINTKKIKTKLLVKNNSIVVIGGIYSQTKSNSVEKVPGVNEVPIVGNAFKNNQNLTERRELLIFISPHIV